MRLIDSHTHLDDAQFNEDRAAVIERARAAGVERVLAIGTGGGPPDLEAGVRLAGEYPFVLATVGVHPHDASKATEATFERLRELAAHPKVVAIGEIGLDYHYDFSPREVQRAVTGLAGSGTQVWPGIDIDVPVPEGTSHCTPEGVKQAVKAVFAGGGTGVILSRNYVEMKPENLSAAGDALRELGLA